MLRTLHSVAACRDKCAFCANSNNQVFPDQHSVAHSNNSSNFLKLVEDRTICDGFHTPWFKLSHSLQTAGEPRNCCRRVTRKVMRAVINSILLCIAADGWNITCGSCWFTCDCCSRFSRLQQGFDALDLERCTGILGKMWGTAHCFSAHLLWGSSLFDHQYIHI